MEENVNKSSLFTLILSVFNERDLVFLECNLISVLLHFLYHILLPDL